MKHIFHITKLKFNENKKNLKNHLTNLKLYAIIYRKGKREVLQCETNRLFVSHRETGAGLGIRQTSQKLKCSLIGKPEKPTPQ